MRSPAAPGTLDNVPTRPFIAPVPSAPPRSPAFPRFSDLPAPRLPFLSTRTFPFPLPALAFALTLTVVLALARPPAAAASELGRPLVRTYPRAEHKAHAQFHAPFQSPEGLMYFGNQLAVMEYDGRSWRVLKLPLPFVRALAAGPQGDIYVGDEEQLGVLARPDSGEPRYTSLLDLVPADAKPFGFVRDVRLWRGDVYFATDKNLLRYRERDRTFRVWPLPGEARNRLFAVDDRLLLHRQGEGLHELTAAGTLVRLSSDPALAAPAGSAILSLTPSPPSSLSPASGLPPSDFRLSPSSPAPLLLALGDRGLFTLSAAGALAPWPTEADAIFRRSPVLVAARLRDGVLAFGTVAEGLVLLDASGKLLRHITRDSGLPQATVFALCEDREGGLWVGTNSAPARVLWRSAATVFDHTTGGITDARANDFVRHRGVLHYLSTDGLYRLLPSADPRVPARFERDPRVDVQTRLSSLLSHPQGGLLVGGGRGLQRLGPAGLELLVAKPDGLIGLSESTAQPARIYFAHSRGVGTGVFAPDGTWRDEGDIPGIDADSYDVHEDAAGALWVGTTAKGVYRAVRPAGAADWSAPAVTRFGPADGLPEGHGSIYLWPSSLGLLHDTARGIYRFDTATGRFVAWRELTAFDPRPLVLNPVAAGAPGELWTNGLATDIKTKESPFPLLHLRRRPDGTFAATVPPPEIQDFFAPGAPYRIFWEPPPAAAPPAPPPGSDLSTFNPQLSTAGLAGSAGSAGTLWAKGDHGLLRLDLARYRAGGLAVAPLIRGISAEGRDLVFPADNPGRLAFAWSREPLTITWVSGLFRRTESERFQTRLVGFNDTWSAPTPRNDIAYTNLEGGPFRFEVRSVDRQGAPGPVSGFTFHVAPPWPRSPAAYALYSLAGAAAVAGFVRWRLRAGDRERRRLERLVADRTAELRLAKDAADAASRAKSVFLANMSHELRTPLNGVIGYAQVLMKDRDLSPKNLERLRIVQTSGEHLLRMINEVLDFSKIEAGKMELAPAPFHLPQLLRDIAAAQQPRAQQKALEFVFDAAPELPDLVVGDSLKLRQVLDNLLGNAIKFTPAGRVTLSVRFAETSPAPLPSSPDASPAPVTRPSSPVTSPPGDHPTTSSDAPLSALASQLSAPKNFQPPGERLAFAVLDTGVGLGPADQAKLFQPFHQAADGRPPEPGTGLGLAISQRFVELMGGRLAVESDLGRGSRFHFTLTLPVLAADATAPAAASERIVGYRGPRRRLLVVDDVATNRHVLRELLAPLDFTVTEADSGEAALALLAADARADTPPPDAIFLDLRMPGIDGLEFARRVRARPEGPRVKLIAMSASVLSFNRQDAFAAGCDDFLPKPFREADLLARLGLALRLEWINAAPAAAPTPASSGSNPPLELRTRLAPPQLAELLAIAQRGEIASLRQHLEPHRGDPFADALLGLARSYRMERIRELLEQRVHPPAR